MTEQLEAFVAQFAGTLGAFGTIAGIIYILAHRAQTAKAMVARGKDLLATFEALGTLAKAQIDPVHGVPLVELVAQIPEITAAQVQTTAAVKELTTVVLENHEEAGKKWQGLELGQSELTKRQEEARRENRDQFKRVTSRLDKIEEAQHSA